MKIFIILLCIGTKALAYLDVDDSFDMESTVKNVTALKEIMDCYLDKGPCTNFMIHGKSHAKESVVDACAECDNRQRHIYRIFLKALKEKLPNEYQAYKSKFDVHKDHFEALERELEKY